MSMYEQLSDDRKGQIKSAVQRNREKMRAMTPLERSATRAGIKGTSPYTNEELVLVSKIRKLIELLEDNSTLLNERVKDRLSKSNDPQEKDMLRRFAAESQFQIRIDPW